MGNQSADWPGRKAVKFLGRLFVATGLYLQRIGYRLTRDKAT